jgi:hypothetical protein
MIQELEEEDTCSKQWIGTSRIRRLCAKCKKKKRKWIGIICDDIMICFGACFVKLQST